MFPSGFIVSGKMIGLRPNPAKAGPLMLASAIATKDAQTFLTWIAHHVLEKRASRCIQVAAVPRLGEERRLSMLATECPTQLTFWKIRRQEVTATFDGGRIVTDAGLLSVRHFEKKLGVVAGLAERLPDPRSQTMLTHSREALFTQRVY